MLQLVDHQGVAVSADALQGDGGARHIANESLQLPVLVRPAGDRCIEREALARGGQGRCWLARVDAGAGRVQAKRLSTRDGPDGNPVADGRALEPRERILALGVEVEPELFPVIVFLRDQCTTAHKGAGDAPDERGEEALGQLVQATRTKPSSSRPQRR